MFNAQVALGFCWLFVFQDGLRGRAIAEGVFHPQATGTVNALVFPQSLLGKWFSRNDDVLVSSLDLCVVKVAYGLP